MIGPVDAGTGGPGGPLDWLYTVLFWGCMGAVAIIEPENIFRALLGWIA